MLGVNYQSIYCKVTKCPHNEKHKVYDGNNKIVEIYYTCEKEDIHINKAGKCQES